MADLAAQAARDLECRNLKENTMPSKSKAQARLMAAAAHDPKVARKAGIPQSVAREFHAADRERGTARLPERKGRRR